MNRALAALGGLLLSAFIALPALAATLEITIQPTATDELGAALPSSGPGALTSHRIEYGTCNGAAFGQALGAVVIAMPRLTASFTVPGGLYCVRAFASNQFGEGKPYPVAIIGPVPSDGGAILMLRQGS